MPLTTPIRLSSTTVSWLVPLVGLLALANTAHAQDTTWTEDTNGDRVHDTTYTDANGDGNPETAKQDLDGNLIIESEFRDPADRGRWTEAWYDFDQNGVIDEYWVDWDGDGYFDQYTNFMSFSLSGEEPGVEPSFEYLPPGAYPTPTSPRPASESRGTSSGTSSDTSSGTTAVEAVWSVFEAAEAASESGDSDHTSDDATDVSTTVAGTDDPPECGEEDEAYTFYNRPTDSFYFEAASLGDAEDKCGEWMIENTEPAPYTGSDPDHGPTWKSVECPDCGDGTSCEVKSARASARKHGGDWYSCPRATHTDKTMGIDWSCGPCEEGDCPDAPDADGGWYESVDTDGSELEDGDADAYTDSDLEESDTSTRDDADTGGDATDVSTTVEVGFDEKVCDGETEYRTYYEPLPADVHITDDEIDSWDKARQWCAQFIMEHSTPKKYPHMEYEAPSCPTENCTDMGMEGCEVIEANTSDAKIWFERTGDGEHDYDWDNPKFYCPMNPIGEDAYLLQYKCDICRGADCPDAPDADGGWDESDDTDDSELESSDADTDADDSGPFIDFDGDKRFSDGDLRLSRTDEGYIADAAMVIPASAEIDCDEDIIFSSPGKITNRNPLDCEGSIAFAAGGAVKFKNGLEVATRGALIVDARSFRAEEGTITADEVEVYVDRRITLNGATVNTDWDITLAARNLRLEEANLWPDDGTVMLDADGPRQNLKDLTTNHAELYTCASSEDGCTEPPIIRMARLNATTFLIDGVPPEDAVDIDLRGRHLAEYSCSVD